MEELLYELEKVRLNKTLFVGLRRYDSAKIQRDREIEILIEVCEILKLEGITPIAYRNSGIEFIIDSKSHLKKSSDIIKYAIEYIENKYNIEVNKEDIENISFKSLKRQIKIAKLGI